MAVHFFYDKTPPFIIERLTPNRHLLQARKQEAGKRLVAFVLRQFQLVLGFEIADVDGSIEHERPIRVGDRRLRGSVEFIFQFSDQLLDHVFHADHSCRGTEFIDHHRQMPLALLEFTQQLQ